MAQRVCPWWVGFLLASPLRRITENPVKILSPYVKSGMTVLEVGPAMGFFTFDAARMVGPEGRLVCVDIQEKMIRSLLKRVAKRGLTDRIDARVCDDNSLGVGDLDGQVDLVLALYIVHEVPDQAALMAELHRALKPQGTMLLVEPSGHIKASAFEDTVETAQQAGFAVTDRPKVRRSRAVVFVKS